MEIESAAQVAHSLLEQKPFSAIALSSSCKSTAGGDGDSVPGLGKNKNSEQSGVTGESTWRFRRVGDEELPREFKPSLISSFLKVVGDVGEEEEEEVAMVFSIFIVGEEDECLLPASYGEGEREALRDFPGNCLVFMGRGRLTS
ncbi:hypothetical protein OIU76_027561 [Salix suchowensis]|nr:hypothetical protein OIU76_027561 [Salix suchowensis]